MSGTYSIEWQEYQPDRGDCDLMVTLPPKPAAYECVQCSHQWRGNAGPVTCPSCGHCYARRMGDAS